MRAVLESDKSTPRGASMHASLHTFELYQALVDTARMRKLRQHAERVDPEMSSYEEIARRVLELAKHERREPRSLSAQIGALDRGKVGWWQNDKHAAVRNALLGLLKLNSPEALYRLVRGKERDPRTTRTLSVLPDATPIDLIEESLFPGVPPQVLVPGDWKRVIWYAPKGAGRSLVAEWLEARRLADVCAVARAKDLPKERTTAALYIELTGETSDEEVRRWLRRGPEKVCVAVPFERRALSAATATTTASPAVTEPSIAPITDVETAPAATWIAPLSAWIAERLPPGGGYHQDTAAAAQLLQAYVTDNIITTPGDALMFAGMIEELGATKLHQQTMEQLAARYLLMQLDLHGRGPLKTQMEPWLSVGATRALSRVAAMAWSRGEDVTDGISKQSWMAELRDAAVRRGSIEAARRSLRQKGSAKQVLGESLAPHAQDTLKSLVDLGVLGHRDGGRLALQPLWLGRVLLIIGLQRAVKGDADVDMPWWGRYLLSDVESRWVLDEVERSAQTLSYCTRDALDRAGAGESAALPAVEVCFRAVGRALLRGTDFDDALLARLWRAQMALAVLTFDSWPMLCRSPIGEGSRVEVHYLLAAWAIAEKLPAALTEDASLALVPWRSPEALRHLRSLAVETWFERRGVHLDDDVRRGALHMLGRLYDQHRDHVEAQDEVMWAMRVVDLVRNRQPIDPKLLDSFHADSVAWERLSIEAARVGFADHHLVTAAWRVWLAMDDRALATSPPVVLAAYDAAAHLQYLWRNVPVDSIAKLTSFINGAAETTSQLIWSTWAEGGHGDRWAAWLSATEASVAGPFDPRRIHRAWKHLDTHLLLKSERLLGDHDFASHVLVYVWARAPEQLKSRVVRALREADPLLESLLGAAPEEARPALLGLLADALETAQVAQLRANARLCRFLFVWLRGFVERRLDGWRKALELTAVLYPVDRRAMANGP